MKLSIIIVFVLTSVITFSQGKDTLNRTVDGKKQGWWQVSEISGSGEAKHTVLIEEGRYNQGKKTGLWKSYYASGAVKTIANYKDGRQFGKFTEYYDMGCIREEGEFGALHYTGNYKMYWENGKTRQEKNFNEKGQLHGKMIYYYVNGRVEMEGEYHENKPKWINRFYNNGDIKEKIVYGPDGPEVATYGQRKDSEEDLEQFMKDCKGNSLHTKLVTDTLKFDKEPETPDVLILDPKKGKVDNEEEKNSELIKEKSCFGGNYMAENRLDIDGEMRNGQLWNGKKYIYDKNGLILKIELWKDGKYVGDGQLE